MPESKADKLAAVLAGESRYSIELDSALRTIGHALPADSCLKWFLGLDDSSTTFRQSVLEMIGIADRIAGERLYELEIVDTTSEEEPDSPPEDQFTIPLRIRSATNKPLTTSITSSRQSWTTSRAAPASATAHPKS